MNTSTDRLRAYVSIRSPDGRSILDPETEISAETIADLRPDEETRRRAVDSLRERGFEVEWQGRLHVGIAAPAALFQESFGAVFEACEDPDSATRAILAPTARSQEAMLYVDDVDEVAGVVFPRPTTYHGSVPETTPDPPTELLIPGVLDFPAGLLRALHVEEVHAQGIRGQGVRAALIDSGFFREHAFFTSRGLGIQVHQTGADQDLRGHGTAMSAMFLSVAPEAELHGLLAASKVHSLTLAREVLGARLISNSWGLEADDPELRSVQAEIAECARDGIAVLHSAGNLGDDPSLAAAMVETISVGGATPCLDGSAEASDVSLSYDGVPDLCGLAGRCGGFVYGRCVQESRLVPQPVPPSTGLIRGWIYRTETSAACAMVAGVAALVLAKFPGLGPGELRRRLRDSAVDVARGVNASSVAAQPGRDAATGAGLVHAAAACT